MATDRDGPAPEVQARGVVKSPQDVAAGLFLIGLALIGYLGSLNLSFGKMSTIGPGLMPRTISLLVAGLGVLLIVQAMTSLGERLEAWSLRGMLFVLGGVIVFAATIRPVGLAVAGPLAVILSAFADRDTKPLEIAAFAVLLTLLCIGMFKFVLRLPIPILPLVLGY